MAEHKLTFVVYKCHGIQAAKTEQIRLCTPVRGTAS